MAVVSKGCLICSLSDSGATVFHATHDARVQRRFQHTLLARCIHISLLNLVNVRLYLTPSRQMLAKVYQLCFCLNKLLINFDRVMLRYSNQSILLNQNKPNPVRTFLTVYDAHKLAIFLIQSDRLGRNRQIPTPSRQNWQKCTKQSSHPQPSKQAKVY